MCLFLPVFEEFIHAYYSSQKKMKSFGLCTFMTVVEEPRSASSLNFPTNADQMEIRAIDASQEITLTTVCSHARHPP